MAGSWAYPELFLITFAGVVGPTVGLAGILFRTRRGGYNTRVHGLISAALAVFAGYAMWCGQSWQMWAPPLVLACAWSALPLLASEWAASLFRVLQNPLLHCVTFIVAGPLLATYWSSKLAQPTSLELPYHLTNFPQLVLPCPLRTDLGREVRAFAFDLEDVAAQPDWEAEVPSFDTDRMPNRVFQVAPADGRCNCHGWVFANGEFLLRGRDVEWILEDNGYEKVDTPQRGDVIVYRLSGNQVVHSGVVHAVCVDGEVQIQSKWGIGGRYLHPPEVGYAGDFCYYRSPRDGHQLIRLPDDATEQTSLAAPHLRSVASANEFAALDGQRATESSPWIAHSHEVFALGICVSGSLWLAGALAPVLYRGTAQSRLAASDNPSGTLLRVPGSRRCLASRFLDHCVGSRALSHHDDRCDS